MPKYDQKRIVLIYRLTVLLGKLPNKQSNTFDFNSVIMASLMRRRIFSNN